MEDFSQFLYSVLKISKSKPFNFLNIWFFELEFFFSSEKYCGMRGER
jgi:hypothetical protein